MKAKKKSKTKRIAIAAVLATAAAIVLLPALLQNPGTQNKSNSNIRSAGAKIGTITTAVSGSGVLRASEAESITLPSGAEAGSVLVNPGQHVARGDVLATVDLFSIRTALSSVQGQLTSLDSRLEQLNSTAESSCITAGVSGRVKAIYAAEGDSVAAATAGHGGLLLLSLDGKMAVTLPPSDTVAVGDKVTVTLSDGSTKEGTVAERTAGSIVVTLTDDGPACSDAVTVTADDGTALGSGTLSVNSPLMVVGYQGIVDAVLVKENDNVSPTTNLFRLTGVGHTPEYEQLLRQRQELLDTFRELLLLEQTGVITAPFDGTVQLVAAGMAVCAISPDDVMTVSVNVDELDILSMQLGQEAAVTINALGSEPFPGTVTAINTLGISASGVTRYAVEITLSKTEQMLSGMNASVEIVIGRSENCLLIPEDALNQSGATTFVYTAYDPDTGTLSGEAAVVTGASDGVQVEIVSGLTEGAAVYYRCAEAEDSPGSPWQGLLELNPW